MIYPLDVHAKAKSGQKMTDSDKVKLGLGVLIVINVGFTFITAELFYALGIPLFIVILVQIALFLFIFVLVFRFAIYREQDRDMDESDVFMQYYKFRPGSRKVKLHIGPVDFFELKNNSCVCVVQFKYGGNDTRKKLATEQFLLACEDLISEKRLNHRFIVMTESFLDTPEFEWQLSKINSISEPKLRATQLEVYSNTFAFTEDNASCETIVLFIYASNAFLRDELEDAAVQIDALYKKFSRNFAFRKMEFLNSVKILEIFRQFYAMGAVDLSLSKIQLNTADPDILKSVILYRITSTDGKTYTNPVFDRIGTRVKKIN